MAHELNDSLLQNTQGIVLRFQAVANRVLPGDPTRELLEVALRRADEVLAAARDRAQDLQVNPQARNHLGESLTVLGEQLAVGRAVEFRVTVEGSAWGFSEQIVDEIYCIGREALVNAFCHAGATTIELLVICGTSDFLLQIRDDGCDIAPSLQNGHPNTEHLGLGRMRERAQKIGAHLQIRSSHETGTEIQLRIARGPLEGDE